MSDLHSSNPASNLGDHGLLENLMMLAPVGIALLGGKDCIVEQINDTMLRSCNKTREQVVGHSLCQVIPGLKGQGLDVIAAQVFQSGQPFVSEEVQVKLYADGQSQTVFAKLTIQPRRSNSGEIIGLVLMVNDTTELVMTRKKIEESETYFRRLIDSLPSTVWTTNNDGYCTFLSQEWYQFTGQSKEQSLGFGWLEAIHPDDKSESASIFQQANENRNKFSLVYRLRTRNNQYRWCNDIGTPKFDAAGNFEGFIGTVIDIDDQKSFSLKVKKAERDLKEAHEKLRIATESASVGTWSLDVKSGTLEWSDLHKRLWGYDEKQGNLQYEDWYSIILEEDRKGAFSKVQEALRDRKQYEALYRIRRPNDSVIRWMRSVGQYFFDENDEALTLTGISIDVTDQKNAEERFRTLAETLPQLVWMTDALGNFDYASKQWEEYTGVDPVSEGAWDKVIHPDDAASVMQQWVKSLERKQPFAVEARLKSKHGQYRWHVAKAQPMKDTSGQVIRWIGAYTDIDEQKMLTNNLENSVRIRTAQLAELNEILQRKNIDLENSQHFLQQLIDSSIEFICVLDRHLNFVTVNKKYEETRGLRREDLTGKNIFDVTPQAKNTAQHESILRSLEGETVYLSKRPTIGVSGFVIDSYFIPLRIQGQIDGVIIMSRDVTDIVRSEQMLAEKNILLERSNQDLQQFAHVTSHDLQEPLRKILIYANRIELDETSLLSANSTEYLSRINVSAGRLKQMVDGILRYSMADSEIDFNQTVDLNNLIGPILNDLELQIKEKNASVTISKLPIVPGSEILLVQLFYNLISNALKFNKSANPLIQIFSVDDVQDQAVIVVKDNGIGFDQQYADRIFKTFWRLNSKDDYEGTGLGLSLCRKIVERHHGKIWAKSKLGKGAEFYIELPYGKIIPGYSTPV